MIRLTDIPGVPELEARMELLPHLSESNDPPTRQKLERIVDFLGLKLGWWGGVETPEVANDDWAIDDCQEEGPVAWWKSRGWDITRSDGGVCRCYRMLKRAMEYIEQGDGGASKVRIEAAIWRVQRDARQGPDPRQRRQDQSFLALGQPSRLRGRGS